MTRHATMLQKAILQIQNKRTRERMKTYNKFASDVWLIDPIERTRAKITWGFIEEICYDFSAQFIIAATIKCVYLWVFRWENTALWFHTTRVQPKLLCSHISCVSLRITWIPDVRGIIWFLLTKRKIVKIWKFKLFASMIYFSHQSSCLNLIQESWNQYLAGHVLHS